jgi:hypothetical protein
LACEATSWLISPWPHHNHMIFDVVIWKFQSSAVICTEKVSGPTQPRASKFLEPSSNSDYSAWKWAASKPYCSFIPLVVIQGVIPSLFTIWDLTPILLGVSSDGSRCILCGIFSHDFAESTKWKIG